MNINNIISQQGIIYDRYLGSTLSLPYSSFEYIKIQPNETVTNFNINNIITKLYENYLYLYKSAHVASNLIPLTSVATLGIQTNLPPNPLFKWYRNSNSSKFSPLSTLIPKLTIDASTVLSVQYNKDSDRYLFFTATSNGDTLWIITCDSKFTSVISTLAIPKTLPNNGLGWSKIQDITFGDNNSMYVLDLSANSIFLYDVSGFLTNNNILNNLFVYENSIGGSGTFTDNTKFNKPTSIDYYNSTLYVLDTGNSCIKTYDKNLNWLTTYRLFRDFLSAGPLQISHDQYGNNYVLNSNFTAYKYSNDFNTKQILDFTALSARNEIPQKLVFSQSDSNVFYFVTNNNVYKKLVNQPYDTVGKYQLGKYGYNPGEQFTAFTTISTSNNGINYDYNFSISNNTYNITQYSVQSYPNSIPGGGYQVYAPGNIAYYDAQFQPSTTSPVRVIISPGGTATTVSYIMSAIVDDYFAYNVAKPTNYNPPTQITPPFNYNGVVTQVTNTRTGETVTATGAGSVNNLNASVTFTFQVSSSTQQPNRSGKISLFQDNLNVTNVLTNDVFDVYPLSGITINREEYLQNWVINKSISKLLMNHMRLRDNISSKFLFTQDAIPGDALLAGTRYLLPKEINTLQFGQDVTNFIGVNEIFQNNIINRPFEKIFNIQTNILSALVADVRNYSSTPKIVYLN